MSSPKFDGFTLKEILERRGITQEELAQKVGVARPTVSQWVTGKAKIRGKNLRAIAEATNQPLAYFGGTASGDLEVEYLGMVAATKRLVELAESRLAADPKDAKTKRDLVQLKALQLGYQQLARSERKAKRK